MNDWQAKTVVVASVSSGGPANPAALGGHLGMACVRHFATRGAHVLALDEDDEALGALAAEAERQAWRVTARKADLLCPKELEQAGRDLDEAHVLVTAHSDLEFGTVEHSSVESWRRVVSFDLLGPVVAVKVFLPALKRAGSAAIVHLGSIDGTLGNPQFPSYSAAKGGIGPLTHVMAQEFAPHGIRVNAIARAFVAGRDFVPQAHHAELLRMTPLGRPGYPEEITAAVEFLASAQAAYVTGAVLPVDGGRSGLTPGTLP